MPIYHLSIQLRKRSFKVNVFPKVGKSLYKDSNPGPLMYCASGLTSELLRLVMLIDSHAHINTWWHGLLYRPFDRAPTGFEHDPPPPGVLAWQWGQFSGPEAAGQDRGLSAVPSGGHLSPHCTRPEVWSVQGLYL